MKLKNPKPTSRNSTPAGDGVLTDRTVASKIKRLLDRYTLAIALLLVLIASARVVSTYQVFSHTADEPAHIACGMEWLERGTYRYESQHPPLARVFAAIGPYLAGRRLHGPEPIAAIPDGSKEDFERHQAVMTRAGFGVLYDGHRYDETLAAARAGVLPFFWLACCVVYIWAKRDFGAPVALTALFLFTSLPPVLAHAGLATTDMALAGSLGAAFLAGRCWLERPTIRGAAVFGACAGLCVLTKFSSLVFLPCAAGAALLAALASGRMRRSILAGEVRKRLPSAAVALIVCLTIVWAGYRFSFGSPGFSSFRMPAPELASGILEVVQHNERGHLSYLLGRFSWEGFWSYYFIVLGVKTPIAFLALAGAGIVFACRSWRKQPEALLAFAFTLGILLAAVFSRINIGIRHILPVYIGLAIVAAPALWHAIGMGPARRWTTVTGGLLVLWLVVASGMSHPDYLPYFNEFAGDRPEKILVDSDLDWGQDLKRLQARLARGGARLLTFSPTFGGLLHEEQGFPLVRPSSLRTPFAGWNAVSITGWKLNRWGLGAAHPDVPIWPDLVPPQEIVGKSIYLWYYPPSSGLPLVDPTTP